MKIINLTPHTVNICDETETVVRSFPSEGNARVQTVNDNRQPIDGIPVKQVSYQATEGLPNYEAGQGRVYIVSMLVAQANPYRSDLMCPNTAPGEVVRDSAGQIIGVKSFARY